MVMCTVLAMVAPLGHYSGIGYMSVLLAAGAMLPLTVLTGDGLNRISKVEAGAELVWVGLALGSVIRVAGANWPGNSSELAVSLVILALGVLTGNREKSVNVCCTLFWVMLIPLIVIGGFLIAQVEPDWLSPEPGRWSAELIAVLLFPSIVGIGAGKRGKACITVGLLAGTTAALVQGGLEIGIAEKVKSPLYELGRCVGNGGFEILVSVVLTLSWYGFASMGMNAAESFGKKLKLTERQSRTAAALIAAGAVAVPVKIKDWVLISGCLIMWILVPMLHPEIKMKKDEKRC